MSLILDALRKMEEDRKSRQSQAQDIRPEVLRYRSAPRTKEPKPYLPMAIVLILLVAVIGAGIFWREKGARIPQTSAPAAPLTPTSPPQLPAATPLPVSATPQAVAPVLPAVAPQPAAVALPAREQAPPQGQPLANAAPVLPPASRHTRKAASAKPASPEAVGMAKPQPQHRDAAEVLQVMPDVTVSGIAWQDERSLRRAVLNGALVGEGAEVAGARVVEIRENKVRMSRGGQLFEVIFSSGSH